MSNVVVSTFDLTPHDVDPLKRRDGPERRVSALTVKAAQGCEQFEHRELGGSPPNA